MLKDQEYVVIIGDIIDSRNLVNRGVVQTKLKAILEAINEKYGDDIVARFKITLGDEFQGLLQTNTNILAIITTIERALSPVQLRFGVGIGTITTEINYEVSAEIDGPAYHRARAMIERMEQKEKQYTEQQTNILLASDTKHKQTDELINTIFALCYTIKSRWTARQSEIIAAFINNEEHQYKTAAALGINQSSVNKALKNADYYAYQSALQTVDNYLNSLNESGENDA